ncbi:unannotated protein [freshwater metagenome]|uniref:Unannotated protein n=1 Tax=freshwater metagenome TaxID=449393 RepID=A0A6J6XCQ1_9ZZZZ
MRLIALAVLVDLHVVIAIHLHPGCFEAETVGIRHGPDREHGVAGPNHAAVVAAHNDPCPVLVVDKIDAHSPRALEQRHPALEEVHLKHRGHLGIFAGQDLLAADDQGDLATQ